MKHCHISIVYNEVAFVKHKLKWMYPRFDQIIFYDLNVWTHHTSDDGTTEFIRQFDDPDGKIILLSGPTHQAAVDVPGFGHGLPTERRMFAAASKHVKADMNVVWTTDLDEFFTDRLMREVERVMREKPNVQVVNVPQLYFFGSLEHVLVDPKNRGPESSDPGKPNVSMLNKLLPRIARHRVGRVYSHCPLRPEPHHVLWNERIYHFSFVGTHRITVKARNYATRSQELADRERWARWLRDVFGTFSAGDNVGRGGWHPSKKFHHWFLAKSWRPLPDGIDVEALSRDLGIGVPVEPEQLIFPYIAGVSQN